MRDQVDTQVPSSVTGGRIALVGIWVAGVFTALAGLWAYKLEAGPTAELREQWPADSSLTASPDRPTLVMFAHPRCPCTRASLSELRIVLSRFGDHIATYVVFMHPAGSSADWSQTDTWATATSLAGVRVVTDIEGREAQLFGATTSGHVVLYDTQRRLLFSGGLTPGRGHQGDSPQLDQLTRMLEREIASTSAATPRTVRLESPGPVYGCPLREDQP